MSAPETAQLDALIQINLADIFESVGLTRLRRGRGLLTALVRPAAVRFAREVITFDSRVAAAGLPAGAEWLLRRFLRRLEVAGRAHLPAHGPLLVLANHPGMVDTVALFVGLGRPDLRIVALERPFLKALPHVSRQLIFVPEAEAGRMTVVRQVAAALRAGQAVLTFPAGEIEPDPAVLPGAVQSLETWSESFAVFARLAPETQILPAIVSGVLSPAAQRNPLTRLRRTRQGRERMAAMFQVMLPFYQGVDVRIALGQPRPARDLLAACPDPLQLKQAVLAQARQLMEQPPAEWETVTVGLR